MITVIDASAALEVVLRREFADKLASYLSQAEWVIAPTLFISEVSNALWKYHRFTDLPLETCERCLEQAVALPDEFFSEKEFYREAFMLSCTADHPIYDIVYLVLARRNNAFLLTLDRRLAKLAQKFSLRTMG